MTYEEEAEIISTLMDDIESNKGKEVLKSEYTQTYNISERDFERFYTISKKILADHTTLEVDLSDIVKGRLD